MATPLCSGWAWTNVASPTCSRLTPPPPPPPPLTPARPFPVTRPYHGRGRPPGQAYPDPPSTLRELALAAGRNTCRRLTWRTGTKKTSDNPSADMRSHFLAVRIRPANRNIPAPPTAACQRPG
uniref:transposase n=1 Tax=Saccharopolyspora phatthalungensis TaxID=664693 RepID=UPI0035E458DD